MPKFAILKNGINEMLLQTTHDKVTSYLQQIFEAHELVKVEGLYSFSFGTVQIEVEIVPWHSEDVLIKVFSYVADNIQLTKDFAEELLRLNATTPFGSFGITFDNSVIFSYSMPGAHLDFQEFLSAIQTVATIADDYDEKCREMSYKPA